MDRPPKNGAGAGPGYDYGIERIPLIQMIYTISTAAHLLGVCPATLRLWEETGVIPAVERDCNGRRVYTEEEMVRLREIAVQRKEARSRSREL